MNKLISILFLAVIYSLKLSADPVVADFSANSTYVLQGEGIEFTDLSTVNPTSWEWDFDNDGVIDSYEQNPTYITMNVGYLTVSLTVSDGVTSDTETKVDYIYVDILMVPAEADFYADQTTVSLGTPVQFNDTSIGPPDTWQWDFENDGTIDSYQQNPQWNYADTGTYTVSLTVDNANGPDTETKMDYITITELDSLALGLVGYWSFDDGTATDNSGNGHNGTVHGSVPFADWDNGKYITFNGDYNNYVQIPHHSDLNFPGSFSICAWIKKISSNGYDHVISKGRDMLSTYFLYHGGRSFQFRYSNNWGGPSSPVHVDDSIFTLNEWHYVACVVDTADMMTNYYLNGILLDQDTIDQAFNITTTYPLIFGRHFTNSTGGSSWPYPCNASLDEVRIYNRALTVSEIFELGGLSAPTTLNDSLVAHYPFNGNANDESGNNNDGTVTGATLTTDRFGNTNSAYEFDGVDDFIETPIIFAEDQDPISITAWINLNSFSNPGYIYGEYHSSSWTRNMLATVFTSQGEIFFDQFPPSGGGAASTSADLVNEIGNWVFISLVKKNDTVKYFVNGSFLESQIHTETYSGSSPTNAGIGSRYMNGSWISGYDGLLDDIRIYNRAITAAEVDSLYHENNWGNIAANFTASDTTITLGDTIQFTDLSTGSPTTWLWDFGDGTTDTVQNPEHIYQAAGTYTVSLVVSDGANSDTLIMVDYINVESNINYFINETQNLDDNLMPADWSLYVHNQIAGLFNGRFEAQPVDAQANLKREGVMPDNVEEVVLNWDGVVDYSFWGQSTSISLNWGNDYFSCYSGNADYNFGGDYTGVTYYDGDNNTSSKLIEFFGSYNYEENYFGVAVTNDSIIFSAISISDGSEVFNVASAIHDSINFQLDSIDLISYSVYTTTGCISWLDNIEITLVESNSPLTANFTASDTTITLGDTIQFTDLSTGSPTTWLWDFGDGTTDTVQNPEHIYQAAGTYTVSLVVSDDVSGDTLIKADYITVLLVPQTILLNNGWNIASFYVTPQYILMDSVFNPLIVETSLTKVIDEAGGFMQEIPGFGWMNTIGNMANTEGYYVKVNQNTQLGLSGTLVDTPFDVPLSTGWNIMGYPTQDTNNAITVLQPLIDSSYLTKVIDESGGFVQEIPGFGWMNTIGDFTPGEGYYIKVTQNCTLTIGREAPTVTTDNATGITYSSATSGGNVTYNGGAPVTARGVCWSTSSNPTLADSYTTNGSGNGAFVSSISGLTPNTQYYVRAYATNSEGIAYGNEVTFTTSATIATVTTNAVTNITATTATSGGNVTSNGGASVTARGVCWSTSSNPTLANSYTTDGTGTGSFTSNLTGLSENSTYYVRAYATNSVGTVYGNEVSFVATQPPFNCGNLLTYEGQSYTTVQIGTQCWMAENLNVGSRIDSVNSQTNNGTVEKYCYNNDPANCDVYGGLYQWDEMMQYETTEGVQGICPNGWHLPTDDEWTTLTTYLGGTSVAGGKLKETGTTHWNSPNTGATNSSGFTALPGGSRRSSGSFYILGGIGFWWSSTETSGSCAWRRFLRYDYDQVFWGSYNKTNGFSVRCLKN